MQPTHRKNGFTLVELILYISITTLCLSHILSISHNIQESFTITFLRHTLFQYLHLARQTAQTQDQDILIKNTPPTIQTQSETKTIYSLKLPPSIQTTITKDQLGFKGNGNTKYAGNITIKSPSKSSTLTLGVGYGKISIKTP